MSRPYPLEGRSKYKSIINGGLWETNAEFLPRIAVWTLENIERLLYISALIYLTYHVSLLEKDLARPHNNQ